MVRALALSLAIVLGAGCAARLPPPERAQRMECRRARAAVAGKGLALTVGSAVVLVAVGAVAALAGGSPSFRGFGNDPRRSRERARRLAVCREPRPEPARPEPRAVPAKR
ncbi:MAG: hypothetical protein AAGH15_07085 [Myxococcota bacterium]